MNDKKIIIMHKHSEKVSISHETFLCHSYTHCMNLLAPHYIQYFIVTPHLTATASAPKGPLALKGWGS